MAKRVPKDEAQFNPLDEALVRAVVNRKADHDVQVAIEEAPAERSATPNPLPKDGSIEQVGAATTNTAEASSAKTVPSAPVKQPAITRRMRREKRVLVTREEEQDVDRFVMRFAEELDTPVKLSHLLRASIALMLHAEEELIERARRATLERPSNGNASQLAQFEHELTEILSLAYREARPARSR